jgi:hypothetical protein
MYYSTKGPIKSGFVPMESIKELKIKRNILDFVNNAELNLLILEFKDIKWDISNWLARWLMLVLKTSSQLYCESLNQAFQRIGKSSILRCVIWLSISITQSIRNYHPIYNLLGEDASNFDMFIKGVAWNSKMKAIYSLLRVIYLRFMHMYIYHYLCFVRK